MKRVAERLRRTYGLRLLMDRPGQIAVLVVVLGVLLTVRLFQFVVFTGLDQWGYDFSAYWLAGRHILDGEPIYAEQQLAGPYPPQQQFLYLYPPFLAVVVTPLAVLFDQYRVAAWAWAATGAVAATAAVVAVARREVSSRPGAVALLLAAAFALPAVVAELVLGNVHVLLLGLLSLAWMGVRRGNAGGEVVAGIAVGVAALIKIFPALMVLWFVLTGRLRAAAAAGVAVVVLAAVTVPLTGLEAWLDYPRVLLNLGPPPNKADALAPAVWLSEVMSFTVARVIVTVVGLAVVVWSARSHALPISFGATVLVSLLVAPALYHTYLTLTVLPFLLALGHTTARLGLIAAYVAMSAGEQPVLGDLGWILSRGLPTLGVLLLLLILLFAPRREGSAAGSEGPAEGDQAAGRAAPPRAATTAAPST